MEEEIKSPCDGCLVYVMCEKREDCKKYMNYFMILVTKDLKERLQDETFWEYRKRYPKL